MSHINGAQADTTEQRKPPALADIVREKTDDGRRIIDFFLDVMESRVDGAQLCHRIDAAKQLEKHRSNAAAGFLAKYRGVPCGHSTRGRPAPADPCPDVERSLVPVTMNAPPTLTRDFLTVLSAVDEDLMTRLVRAQTLDGGTIVDFLYDVMQDSVEGFKCNHRIAAAKELIAHIVRDEAPESADRPVVVGADPRVRPLPISAPSTREADIPGVVGADPHTPAAHPPSSRDPATQLNSKRARGSYPLSLDSTSHGAAL